MSIYTLIINVTLDLYIFLFVKSLFFSNSSIVAVVVQSAFEANNCVHSKQKYAEWNCVLAFARNSNEMQCIQS